VLIGAAAVVGALALVAGASVVLLGSDGGPEHPDRWDPRVAGIVGWLERERDLRFDHPVAVDFLSPARYRAAATTSDEELTPEDRRAIEQYGGAYRALGLAEGPVDLLGSSNEVSDTGTLAFYDAKTERITVRGTELTAGLRVTLAHELTHALQDQHFGLDQLYEDASDVQPDSYDTQLRAIVEGDATRMEERYVSEELTQRERTRFREEQQDTGEEANEELEDEDVPPGLLGTFSAPYWFGPRFVSLLEQEEGSEAIDDALRLPPSSSEQLFDPIAYLNGDRAVGVDPIPAPKGATVLEQGPFGSVQWYLMLAERVDPDVALRAVDGWGGDASTVWADGDDVCVRAAFSGDTPDDDEEMLTALEDWVDALPDGMATVDQGNGTVSFESCDPGPGADLHVTGRSGDALAYPAVRTDIVTSAMGEGAEADDAFCLATQIVSALTPEQLLGEDDFAESPAFQQVIAQAQQRCA
jgi:hypothetical protein